MNPLTRRGIMQGLAAVAGLMTRPGAEAAKAAISIAEAPGASALLSMANTASGEVGHRAYERKSVVENAAIDILERRTYGPPAKDRIRASISCFKSASDVSKSRWEVEADEQDADRRAQYRQILDWLHEGKIKL